MRERVPFTSGRTPTSKSTLYRPVRNFSSEEKRTIFKGMVVGELEAGFLRYSKRQALLRYAAGLNIPEFEACLLIAEAQYRAGDIEPAGFNTTGIIDQAAKPVFLSIPWRLGLALTIAIFIDLALIWWFL